MEKDLRFMDMPREELPGAWERHIESALSVKTSTKDELKLPRLTT